MFPIVLFTLLTALFKARLTPLVPSDTPRDKPFPILLPARSMDDTRFSILLLIIAAISAMIWLIRSFAFCHFVVMVLY